MLHLGPGTHAAVVKGVAAFARVEQLLNDERARINVQRVAAVFLSVERLASLCELNCTSREGKTSCTPTQHHCEDYERRMSLPDRTNVRLTSDKCRYAVYTKLTRSDSRRCAIYCVTRGMPREDARLNCNNLLPTGVQSTSDARRCVILNLALDAKWGRTSDDLQPHVTLCASDQCRCVIYNSQGLVANPNLALKR